MKKTIIKSIISEIRAITLGIVLSFFVGSNPNANADPSELNIQVPPGSVIIVVTPTLIS